ncbi:Thiol-disulfide isomerase or thioredoxin [Pedobacter caeni]|uniref:Thiol-disulfide isomerase or thioredoxin n=2 Tax=Pedobacter caeni TaxID=288992 RepID=A0A1M5J3S2_9SPHI|nr:Thiol-disulfide isomerase or thioredoxin [Pedobacter caeni]
MLAVLLYTASCFSQQGQTFTLKGKATGGLTGIVYLRYLDADGKMKLDSSTLQNNSFFFKGRISEPAIANFYGRLKTQSVEDPNTTQIFLEPTEMNITVAKDQFKNLVMKGSKSQQEMESLALLKKPIRKEMEPVLERLRKEKDHEKAAEIRDSLEPFNKREGKIEDDFFASHPDSYVTAYMMRYKMGELNLAQAEQIYNSWTSRIKESSYGKETLKEVNALKGGSPGAVVQMFSAKDINGAVLNLADFKGKKYVLLDFWASWCVPCRKGNPHLLGLYRKYKDKGLEIVGVASDDRTPDAWRKAVEKDGIGVWKHVLSGPDRGSRIGESFGIHTLPTKILVDKNGIIVGRYGGNGESDEAMDKKMSELFGK